MFVRHKTTKIIHPEDQEKPAGEQRWIEIRTRMNQGQKAAFWDEVSAVNREVGLCSNEHFNLLMMAHNIINWGGPDTEEEEMIAFSESAIQELDPNDPLVLKVIETLDENNRRKESPDPKSVTVLDSTTSSDDGTTRLTDD